ncbi:hypothetical protein BH23GEM10_BH23GEM10_02280 [soil metagenome]
MRAPRMMPRAGALLLTLFATGTFCPPGELAAYHNPFRGVVLASRSC